MRSLTLEQVRAELAKEVEAAGGVRAYARRHRLSAAYVSDMIRGRRDLGPGTLESLGLEKQVIVQYKRVQ